MRKLVVSSTVVFMLVSMAFASGASAMLVSDPSGSAQPQAPVTSTPGSFPWGDVALGVALAAIAAVCFGAALYLSRNRRRLAALHS